MQPIEFPEHTMVWAESQDPYLPLPAYVNHEETISCWQLTWGERFRLLFSGRLWLRQLNFRQPLQPQKPQVENPFDVARGDG